MISFEYKVVPAPKKGKRGKGLRTPEQKFAHAVQVLMNEMGADGWQYQRSDTLPSEERQGLTGRTKVFRTLLVFRRQVKTGPDRARELAGLGTTSGQAALTMTAEPPLTVARPLPQNAQAETEQTTPEPQDAPGDVDAAQLRDTLSESLTKGVDPESAQTQQGRADN